MCTLMKKCSSGGDEAGVGGLWGVGSWAAVRLVVGHPASQSRRCSGTQKPVPGEWGERPLACTLLPARGRVGRGPECFPWTARGGAQGGKGRWASTSPTLCPVSLAVSSSLEPSA